MKMRREWIRTDQQRQSNELKRISTCQHFNIEQSTISKRTHRSMSPTNVNESLSDLSSDECLLIKRISQTYDLYALNNNKSISIYSLNSSSLTDFLNNEEKVYKNLIEYFKSIPEFKQIHLEDQILLIKCNITHLVHIHHALKDNFSENGQIGLNMSQWINYRFHQMMSNNRSKFNYFAQHPIVLKISLIIFIFSINLSRLPTTQLNCQLNNQSQIFEHQNYFLTLLVKYLNTIYTGNDSNKAIEILVFQYLQYQLLMEQMEEFIRQHLINEQLYPLTKSVLRLT